MPTHILLSTMNATPPIIRFLSNGMPLAASNVLIRFASCSVSGMVFSNLALLASFFWSRRASPASPRFSRKVTRRYAKVFRSLLCVPLRDEVGAIRVVRRLTRPRKPAFMLL